MPVNQELLNRRLKEMSSWFGVPGVYQGPEELPPGDFIDPRYAEQAAQIEAARATPEAPPIQQRLDVPQPRVIAPTESERKYAELAGARPTQAQYAPGKLRRIAAIASGLGAGLRPGGGGGYQTARAVLMAPYREALEEWQSKAAALEPVMKLEQLRAEQQARLYGADVDVYEAQLRKMSWEDLNEIKRQKEANLQAERIRQLAEKDTQRQFERDERIQRHLNDIAKIDRELAGRKEVTGMGTESRERIATEERKVQREEEAGRTARFREGQRGEDLPYTKERMGAYELQMAQRLTRTRPGWSEFIKYNDDGTAQIVSIEDVPKEMQPEYKKFTDLLAAKTRQPLNIERIKD